MRKPHEQRVIDEQTELAIKLGKLREFNDGEFFQSLPVDERLRLQMQANAMMLYLYILNSRIGAFPNDS